MTRKGPPLLTPLILILLVAAAYGPVGGHAFITLDDPGYVTENAHVRQGLTAEGIAWAFTASEMSNWHPLTWISHMADVTLFGLDAGMHHLVNVLLHALNSVLLFLAIRRMTGDHWRSAAVAAIFAVHPLHVESVAWVSERKELLAGFFWMLSLWAYAGYARRGGAIRYASVLACFAMGLLAKPIVVTLPFVLLLLDYWPLGRLSDGADPSGRPRAAVSSRFLVVEKLPMLLLSALSCAVTLAVQRAGGAVGTSADFPPAVRVGNAIVSYAAYLGRIFRPSGLSPFYPHPGAGLPAREVVFAAILLASVTATVVAFRRRAPFLPVGWFWFLGTLVPVIGLVQVGFQAMADRYAYLPLAGISIAVVWGASLLPGRSLFSVRREAVAAFVLAFLLLAMAWASRIQASYWRDSVTLFRHALAVTPDNWLSRYNLGLALGTQGHAEEAVAQLREARRMRPNDAHVAYDLAVYLQQSGRTGEASALYREVLRLRPDDARAWVNSGNILLGEGRIPEAIACYEQALRVEPGNRLALFNLRTAVRMGGEKLFGPPSGGGSDPVSASP